MVIVCAGRIERPHVDAIKQFMDWLQFKEYKKNFVLIYNKSDLLTEAEKMENLVMMCNKFGVPTLNSLSRLKNGKWHSVKMNLAIGFPENATYESVKEDHEALYSAVVTNVKNRIPVDKRSCTIL